MAPRRAFRFVLPGVLIMGALLLIRMIDSDGTHERDGLTFAGEELARVLDGSSDGLGVRVVERFTDAEGVPCRAFLGEGVSGIACRKDAGWHLRVVRSGVDLSDPAATARTEQALLRSAEQIQAQ